MKREQAYIIAEVILKNLRKPCEETVLFTNDLIAEDPCLDDFRQLASRDARIAWNFGGSYFDAYWHRLPDVDGLTLDEARELLETIANDLLQGKHIVDERLSKYAH